MVKVRAALHNFSGGLTILPASTSPAVLDYELNNKLYLEKVKPRDQLFFDSWSEDPKITEALTRNDTEPGGLLRDGLFLIHNKETGEVIGFAGYYIRRFKHQNFPATQIYIIPEMRGKGFSRTTLRILFQILINKGYKKVLGTTSRYNIASQTLMFTEGYLLVEIVGDIFVYSFDLTNI